MDNIAFLVKEADQKQGRSRENPGFKNVPKKSRVRQIGKVTASAVSDSYRRRRHSLHVVGINTLHLAANPYPANLGIGDEGNCCKFSLETINVSQENVPSAVQSAAGFPFRRKSFKREFLLGAK